MLCMMLFIFLFLLSIYLLARAQLKKKMDSQFIFQSGLTRFPLLIVHGTVIHTFIFMAFFPIILSKRFSTDKKMDHFLYVLVLYQFSNDHLEIFIYDSFFPYFKLYDDWHLQRVTLYEDGFLMRHYIRFFLMFVIGNNILILLSLLHFIFTTDKTEKTSFRIFMSSVFIFLILSLLYKVNVFLSF